MASVVPTLPAPDSQGQTRKGNARKKELRGVWFTNVDSQVLASRENIASALQRLGRLNFTTAYMVVYNSGKTLYPSATMKKHAALEIDNKPEYSGRDPLQEFMEEGKKNEITVVPWFEWGMKVPPGSSLAKQNPSWLTSDRAGLTSKNSGGLQISWLNIALPEVQNFFVSLVSEVIAKYNPAQIQFDDNFAVPADFFQHKDLVARYKSETGKNPPATAKEGGWDQWVTWRTKVVTESVVTIFKRVKAKHPNVTISVSPNPLEWSIANYLLDWKAWLQSGTVDTVVVQLYRNSAEALVNELNRASLASVKNKVAIGLLSGLRTKPVDSKFLQSQVEAVRGSGYAGVSFFFYDSLFRLLPVGESEAKREAMIQGIFSESSKEPEGF